MARGWESKSVESQQSEEVSAEAREQASREALEKLRKREGLELSRRRVVRELETARNEVHRTALTNALAHLDGELAKLQ